MVVIIAAIITTAGTLLAVMIEDNPTQSNKVDSSKENALPTISGLTSHEPTPQYEGEAIHWEAAAFDPDGDRLFFKFLVNGKDQTGWTTDKTWTWENTEDYIGDNIIDVWIRDGRHTDLNSFDDHNTARFTIETSLDQLENTPHPNPFDVEDMPISNPFDVEN